MYNVKTSELDPQRERYLGVSFGLCKLDFEVEELGRGLLELLGRGTLLIGQLSIHLLFLRK